MSPSEQWILAHVIPLGYVLGSIPFGLVITRFAGLGDLRQMGSGNIGATNVLRTGRKDLALATLILDSSKGAMAALLAMTYGGWLLAQGAPPSVDVHRGTLLAGLGAGAAAVVGHNFPIWLRFKGGKGVATTLGTLIATAWPVGLGACLVWLLTAFVSRYSSLAALVALGTAPISAFILAQYDLSYSFHPWVYGALAVMAFWRHRENIARLRAGTESRIGDKSKKS